MKSVGRTYDRDKNVFDRPVESKSKANLSLKVLKRALYS